MSWKNVVTVILIVLGLGGAFLGAFGFGLDRTAMGVGGVALFVVSVVAAKIVQRRWRRGRAEGLSRLALELGFEYEHDPRASREWPGALSLRPGRSTNVLRGEWEGYPVTAFDETWRERRLSPYGKVRSEAVEEETRSAAVTPLPRQLPATVFRSRSSIASLTSDLGGKVRAVVLGTALDQTFEVFSEDPAFARRIVDEGMEGWLASAGEGFTFEVGTFAICSAKGGLEPLEPEGIRSLIEAVVGFREHIPEELVPQGGT